jgi:proline iminopeptidase
MPAEDGGLFALVRERLSEEMRPDYDDWQKRYFDYGAIFSKSEAELAALNDEFKPFYYAAAPGSFPEQGQTGGWAVHALYFSMGQRHNYRAAMKNVTAPVLVIHGADDLQPEEASRMYAEAFPNARFEVIGNATHFPFEEQPQEFGAIVGEFLSALR